MGTALEKLGAECFVCTGIGFESDIKRATLKTATLDVDFRPLLSPEFIDSTRSLLGIYRAWKETRGFQGQFLNSLWQTIKKIQPDLIVYHHNKGAPVIYVAEALGVPAIPTALIPAYIPTRAFRNPFSGVGKKSSNVRYVLSKQLVKVMDFGLRQSVKNWRRNTLVLTGIAKRNAFTGYSPENKKLPRLHLLSESILPKPRDWPSRDIVSGYCFVDREKTWRPPKALAAFLKSGSPPIYVGFGSLPIARLKDLTEIVINALSKTGHRGILMTGSPEHVEIALPKTILSIGKIPHDWLFPQCAAIVHHGGVGTVHQALRWGKPSIICPMFLDQPFWGEIVDASGAGILSHNFKNLSGEQLANDIIEALSPSCINSASLIGSRMRKEEGATRAAKLILAVL